MIGYVRSVGQARTSSSPWRSEELKKGLRLFSQREIFQLIASFVILTLSFSLVFQYPTPSPTILLISMISVGIGFVLHELAHRFVALKHGYIAEYQASRMGLLLTIALPILTFGHFLFAAPGAVMIYETPHTLYASHSQKRRAILQISIAGILTNIALGFVFLTFLKLGILYTLSYYGAYVNAILAGFNLIPFGPLDGAKVFRLNPKVWTVSFALALSLFFILSNF